MATHDVPGLVEVSQEDRLKLAAIAARVAELLEDLALKGRSAQYPPASLAAKWVSAYEELPSPRGVEEVILAISHIFPRLFAASDYLRAMSVLLRRTNLHVSIASLTRACIEVIAKVSFVMTAESALDFARRNIQLIRLENKFLGRYQEVDVAGQPVSAVFVEATIKSAAERFGVTEQPPGTTKLAADLFDRNAQEPTGRHYYSHISAFAHGEVDALKIWSRSQVDDRPILPGSYACEYVGMAVGTCFIVTLDLLTFFGIGDPLRTQWATSYDECRSDLSLLVGAYPDYSDTGTL